MLDSKALTKIQSIILITIIVVVAVGGGVAYVLLSGEEQSSDTIKIGVLADLDVTDGRNIWQGVVLAAEQLNNDGGILGKQIEYVGEDTDTYSGGDATKFDLALTRLLTYHKVDFIIGVSGPFGFMVQESISEHKKIFLEIGSNEDEYSQRVVDDYDKYKYFFRTVSNATSVFQGTIDGLLHLREQTGLNKIGYLAVDMGWARGVVEALDYVLPEVYGFNLVYKGKFPLDTVDFSSYFAAAEAAGVEAMLTLIVTDMGIPFVKEYYDRQSPIFLFGGLIGSASYPESYEWTDGKCEDVYVASSPVGAGYPFTSKTLSTRQAYIERWSESPYWANQYDIVRFILADAIERAGTIETEAVIKALEKTSVETSNARNFVFTPSHSVMMGKNPNDPNADYMISLGFQWQDGNLVPVDPIKIMEEAGATYTFPDWPGSWDNLN